MFKEYENKITEWMKNFNWRENPFTLKILPSLFVGYRNELEKIIQHIKENHKFALIKGSTGSGKTTLLKLIKEEMGEDYKIIYLSKPPEKNDIISIFLNTFKPNFFERLFGSDITLYDLPQYINKKSKNDKVLILLDETHESSLETLEWMRTIIDQTDNLQLIMAALPVFEEKIKNKLDTLINRITTFVELNNLNRDETYNLIKKRIENVGGEGIRPFTEESIRKIHEVAGGFPREILKLSDGLVRDAIKESKYTIEEVEEREEISSRELPEQTEETSKPKDKDFLRDLPYKQRKILKLLSEKGDLFPSEIVDNMSTKGYKTRQHAVRSINNILRRLIKEGYVKRKERRRGYVYSLTTKIRNILIEG